MPRESCGFSGIVRAERACDVVSLEGRVDVGRVPVGVAHDELGAGEDIDPGQIASRQPGLLEQLASCVLLEALAWFDAPARQAPGGVIASELEENGVGRPAADEHAGGDQDIVWVGYAPRLPHAETDAVRPVADDALARTIQSPAATPHGLKPPISLVLQAIRLRCLAQRQTDCS